MSKSFRANSDYQHTHRDRRNLESSKHLRDSRKHTRELQVDIKKPDPVDPDEANADTHV